MRTKNNMDKHKKHIEVLKRDVFETNSKYPQFNLLIQNIESLANKIKANEKIVMLERTLMYGGYSLFGPLFSSAKFISIDCSPEKAEERGPYNKHMISSEDFIRKKYDMRESSWYNLKEYVNNADYICIPNLVHHVKDQSKMVKAAYDVLKPGGYIYIFEPLVREIHQIPDDYLRYTQFGMQAVLEKEGFEVTETNTTGGAFENVWYCWLQALQYLPESQLDKIKEKFDMNLDDIIRLDNTYLRNTKKSNTEFPSAFSIWAKKL